MVFKVNNIVCGNRINITSSTSDGSIAIGYNAGTLDTTSTVAIGASAGRNGQGASAVAIGTNAGNSTQGANSIAIGNNAATVNQTAGSICLNATGTAQQAGLAGLFINPIRQVAIGGGTNLMYYNSTTKEILYDIVKTFVIDHPLDSERYLVHACLEGPEAGVYYRGEGKIENESVTVTLPDYTTAFIDFTINLTPIGKCISLATSRVKNGKFEVYGEPCEFFWTVYAKRGNVVVEPLKSSVKLNGDGPYKWLS
jgi:hypothetical protein